MSDSKAVERAREVACTGLAGAAGCPLAEQVGHNAACDQRTAALLAFAADERARIRDDQWVAINELRRLADVLRDSTDPRHGEMGDGDWCSSSPGDTRLRGDESGRRGVDRHARAERTWTMTGPIAEPRVDRCRQCTRVFSWPSDVRTCDQCRIAGLELDVARLRAFLEALRDFGVCVCDAADEFARSPCWRCKAAEELGTLQWQRPTGETQKDG